jgi:outer membrane protein assembly factor BamB
MHIVAGSQQGDVVCVSRETGRMEWVRTGIGRVMFAPIGDVKHGCAVVFVQDTDAGIPAEVLGLDLRSGRTLWRARVGNLDAAPVLTGDRLWIASATGTIYAFDYG